MAKAPMKRPKPAKMRVPMEWNQLRMSALAQFYKVSFAPLDFVLFEKGFGDHG